MPLGERGSLLCTMPGTALVPPAPAGSVQRPPPLPCPEPPQQHCALAPTAAGRALPTAALPHAHGSPNPLQGVKEFKCEVCGREFTLQANMKRHMLIHTSVRPYQCHICFKTFVQKQTLKTHMIVHSPVKPFKCKVPLGIRGV